jgi:zinc-ribbon domain
MATFCASCGSPLADGTRFCEKCGAAVTNPPTPSARIVTSAPIAQGPSAPKSNTAIKVIVGILAVFMFLFLLVAGSCAYIAYRAKGKLHEFSKEMENVPAYTGKREPCAMLTADEASRAIGSPVSSAEPFGTSICRYTYGAEGNRQFDVQYSWQGAVMTMKVTTGAMKHISGMKTFTLVDGVGDEAYLGPMASVFMLRKGDVLVNMNLQSSGVTPDAAQKMGEIIAGRL